LETKYDLAGQVIGAAMKVHRALGPGFLESVYQKALVHELRKSDFTAEEQKAIKVKYDGVVVGDYLADLVINSELIVEIKAVQTISLGHELQTVNYLAATGHDHGLILNFGGKSLEFKKKFRTFRPTTAVETGPDNSVNSV
jgi:GxxExxY protein